MSARTRNTFERSDGKGEGITMQEVIDKLLSDVGIDVIRSKTRLQIERQLQDPFKLQLLEIDGTLTPTQEAAIITAFPELSKRP